MCVCVCVCVHRQKSIIIICVPNAYHDQQNGLLIINTDMNIDAIDADDKNHISIKIGHVFNI